MAHRDPGVHNWLDTQGFERGNLTYRHMLEGEPAVLDHPGGHATTNCSAPCPREAAMVSEPERVTAMWERFHGIRRRYVL